MSENTKIEAMNEILDAAIRGDIKVLGVEFVAPYRHGLAYGYGEKAIALFEGRDTWGSPREFQVCFEPRYHYIHDDLGVVVKWRWDRWAEACRLLPALAGRERWETSSPRAKALRRAFPRARWLWVQGELLPWNRAARRAAARHPERVAELAA